ncbi:nucleotide excision repair protein, with UvrB/UvrC motif [Lachnospiraceae bacterium KM106-2]|nr:nucleotide excision repair protein, with UvrB/UvrC motif [Lachnospiraceae bacterium KM106-2]
MLCDRCHKREARIYYTEIIGGQKKEQHLCRECAAEYTSWDFDSQENNKEVSIGNLLSSILSNYYGGSKKEKDSKYHGITCSNCKMTYDEFIQGGKFGCSQCYQTFSKQLDKSITRLQGAQAHVGKRPNGFVSHTDQIIRKLSEIDRLELKLQDAVEKEEFEEAAKLRDQIRELKKKEEIGNA